MMVPEQTLPDSIRTGVDTAAVAFGDSLHHIELTSITTDIWISLSIGVLLGLFFLIRK